MNEFTSFANRDVQNLIFVDYNSDKELLNCDFANVTATEVTGDAVFAYGGQGHPKKVGFNGDKGGTLKVETQMQSAKLYSLLSGADILKTAKWLKREVIKATTNSLTLSETPISTSVNIYKIDDDCGTAIVGTVSENTVSGTGIKSGDTYIVYYQVELTNVQNVSIKSTSFPKAVKVYGETWDKTENEDIIAQKMVVYKAQPQNSFSVTHSNSGDPATVTITCDLMADGDNNMLDLIFEDDAA